MNKLFFCARPPYLQKIITEMITKSTTKGKPLRGKLNEQTFFFVFARPPYPQKRITEIIRRSKNLGDLNPKSPIMFPLRCIYLENHRIY